MKIFNSLYFCWFLFFLPISTSIQELILPLEFSLEEGAYQQFGSITLKKIFDGTYTAQFSPISTEKINVLKNALASNPLQTNYKIRSNEIFSTNSVEGFIRSKYAHQIELSIDPESQKVLSLTHFPAKHTNSSSKGLNFVVDTIITTVNDLPGPDTFAYLQRLEEEKRVRQQGATQDNRSFLQKYWIYFVPVLLFVVLSNAFTSEQAAAE